MAFDWSSIFDHFGIKRVTSTDIKKGAYVPNELQKAALAAAALTPSPGGDGTVHRIEVLFDAGRSDLQISYYNALRTGAGRPPETRIGRELISWAKVDDLIVIGSTGSQVFAAKASAEPASVAEAGRELSQKLDPAKVFEKAKRATGKPARKSRTVSDFVRDPNVVAAAILRSGGQCEMPGCQTSLFLREDGAPFLEVHHITPLAEEGEDTLANAAALCPMCHRELHHGALRKTKRATLGAHVASILLP